MKMQWKRTKDGAMKLHLKRSDASPWLPYDTQPESLPESHHAHSKGWNTYQALRQKGWQLVDSERS